MEGISGDELFAKWVIPAIYVNSSLWVLLYIDNEVSWAAMAAAVLTPVLLAMIYILRDVAYFYMPPENIDDPELD